MLGFFLRGLSHKMDFNMGMIYVFDEILFVFVGYYGSKLFDVSVIGKLNRLCFEYYTVEVVE